MRKKRTRKLDLGMLQSPLPERAPTKNNKRALLFSETPNSKEVASSIVWWGIV